MEELKANHEAAKLDLENSHTEQLQCVKQQYEMSLEGEWNFDGFILNSLAYFC